MLFSIGLTFMAVAGATWLFGPTQQPVNLPDWLRGQVHVLGLDFGAYRLFLIGVVVLVTAALVLLIERTRFGALILGMFDVAGKYYVPEVKMPPLVKEKCHLPSTSSFKSVASAVG